MANHNDLLTNNRTNWLTQQVLLLRLTPNKTTFRNDVKIKKKTSRLAAIQRNDSVINVAILLFVSFHNTLNYNIDNLHDSSIICKFSYAFISAKL